jgi:hypothetical protein
MSVEGKTVRSGPGLSATRRRLVSKDGGRLVDRIIQALEERDISPGSQSARLVQVSLSQW